jgi:hypothetical protein
MEYYYYGILLQMIRCTKMKQGTIREKFEKGRLLRLRHSRLMIL